MNNIEEQENVFLKKVKKELDAAADDMDALTLARLRSFRMRALDEAEQRKGFRFVIPPWMTASGVATLCAMVVAVSIWFTTRQNLPTNHPEDVEILAAQEQLDLYKDLDFYSWLASTDNDR
jgi:hypothetical protein